MSTRCTVCRRKDLAKIDAAIGARETIATVAARYHVAPSTLGRHARNCLAIDETDADTGPQMLALSAKASPQEAAWAHVQFLEARLNWAVAKCRPEREVAALASARTSALRHHARVTGAYEPSEQTVCRSAAFRRVEASIVEALRPYPEAAADVAKALGELVAAENR
jgi:hypothetical protein